MGGVRVFVDIKLLRVLMSGVEGSVREEGVVFMG